MKQIRTSQMRIGLIAAMLAMTVGVGSATGLVTGDSTTWEGSYECDDLPVTAGWLDLNSGNAYTTVESDANDPGGNKWIHTALPDDGEYYRGYRRLHDPGAFDAQTNGGITFEFRIRVTNRTVYMQIYPSSAADGRWLAVYVSTNNVTIMDGDRGAHSDIGNINPGDWTTLRISCDDTSWKVYRDTDQSIEAEVTVDYDREEYLFHRFSIWGLYPATDFELDYFRWTDAGAFDNSLPPDSGYDGYKASDFNTDCYVDLADFYYIVDEWLNCTDPNNPDCD